MGSPCIVHPPPGISRTWHFVVDPGGKPHSRCLAISPSPEPLTGRRYTGIKPFWVSVMLVCAWDCSKLPVLPAGIRTTNGHPGPIHRLHDRNEGPELVSPVLVPYTRCEVLGGLRTPRLPPSLSRPLYGFCGELPELFSMSRMAATHPVSSPVSNPRQS